MLMATALGLGHADQLTLTQEDRLSGSVRSISSTGVIELISALAPEPLHLRAGAVKKVDFSIPASGVLPPTTLVELRNGDILPVTIEKLDDQQLAVITADAGRISILRADLKSMQLGMHSQQTIYSGPRDKNDWANTTRNAPGWTFSNNSLVANGPSSSSRTFDLPKRFTIKFTLKWQDNPSYLVSFADPLRPEIGLVDRYTFQFNAAGMEIKRESAVGKRFQTVILIGRTPEEFPENEVDVEIRVDRSSSRLHLFLDGEAEGAGVDPAGMPPTGQGVTLINQVQAGISQEIRAIEILEFDNSRARHLEEKRGDIKLDSLISREEDRWSGQLIAINQTPGGSIFSFKSDFQEAPLELDEDDVSTVFFAQSESSVLPPAAAPLFALRLRGQGILRVSSCIFSEDSVTAVHPLLGALTLKRAGVSALELLDPESESVSEEKLVK